MFMHIKRRALTAASVIVAAGIPSAASARPIIDPPSSTYSLAAPTVQTAAPRAIPPSAQGFHWDDAGLGAAGILVLVGVGTGAAVAVRRRGARALTG